MSINSKNTKAEILAAYKELEKQKKNLESEFKKTKQNKSVVNPLTSVPVNKSSQINQQSNNKDILNTIQFLEQIQGNFGVAVGNLSEQLITEAKQLEVVKEAIAREKLELKTLHQLSEISESTINVLFDRYQTNAKKFTEEFQQQQESNDRKIQALKLVWTKEQETYLRSIKTRNEDDRKSQQREKEEYQYNLDKARDLDEGKYEREKKLKYQELTETRQELEKQWQQKEVQIVKQEQEYAEAIAKVAAFKEQLRAKIKQGTEEGKGIGIYQAKIKADLRNREIEGAKQNYQLKIESLEQTIKHQEARISKLSQQLDGSLQQVQDLAVKAIEGTSNRNSFEAIKAIAMEQAKTSPKGK